MTAQRKGISCLLVLLALTAIGAFPLGNAQNRATPRLGRPLDWSHAHLVAARGGPDRGLRIYSDWRTLFRHIELDQALSASTPSADRRVGPKKPPGSTSDLKLDWSLNTGGTGSVVSFPAKYSFDITASSCSDVIYFGINQAGGASTVNVIAITNPYAGCPGNATGSTPTIKFGIALPFTTAQLSPVLSLDGTVLYIMEGRPSASGGAILHAINVNNITTNPGTYDFGTGTWTSVHTLAAPTGLPGSEQLFELAFAGVDDVRSSPYLDYTGNQIFFGDSVGRVHRVINVNTTTPSEDTTNFPVACGTGELRPALFVNGQVITTSADGKLYRIDTTVAPPFTCVASAAVGTGANAGDLAAAMIDITNNKIIVVTGRDAGGSKRIALFDLMFTAGASPLSSQPLGDAVNIVRPRIPAFDNAFLMTNSGNLYAGGSPTGANNVYLIRIPYNGTTLSTPAGFAELHHTAAGSNQKYSPVTAFLTGSSLANPDFVYIGASGGTYPYMNRIATGFSGTNAAPVSVDSFFAVTGGADSGIIIDNRTSGVTGGTATANIYFGSLGGVTQSQVFQLAQQF